jgi:hypothetical protein
MVGLIFDVLMLAGAIGPGWPSPVKANLALLIVNAMPIDNSFGSRGTRACLRSQQALSQALSTRLASCITLEFMTETPGTRTLRAHPDHQLPV